MSAITALHRGRRRAEALMVDRAVVRRKTDESINEDFEVIPVYEIIYGAPVNGVCGAPVKLQTYEGHEVEREATGQTVIQQRSTVHFPAGAFLTMPGDIVTVVASFDPLLVGRSWRIVQEYPVKTFMTAYRVFVDETIGEPVPPLPEIEEG